MSAATMTTMGTGAYSSVAHFTLLGLSPSGEEIGQNQRKFLTRITVIDGIVQEFDPNDFDEIETSDLPDLSGVVVTSINGKRGDVVLTPSEIFAMTGTISVSAVTNNVTVGGTTGILANFTDLTTYANDAATIRNNIYQLGLMINTLIARLETIGLIS